MVRRIACAILVASGIGAPISANAESRPTPNLVVEVEGGPVWQTRNDVQIPNDATGTRFSLAEVAGKGPWPATRAYVTWNLNEEHGLRVLMAPLSITEMARLASPIDFAGESFGAGTPTEATYKFNSWRLGYRYRFYAGDRWRWWVGFTAKVRDAKVRLEQVAAAAEKTDLGFVPLLHIAGAWRLTPSWSTVLEAEGLAGGPGRAVDAAAKLKRDFGDRWSVALGYRTVEGGADVDAVYNFAWLHYAVISASAAF